MAIKRMLSFDSNNERQIYVTQESHDGVLRVIALASPDFPLVGKVVDYQYEITPSDFVTMLNWYRAQKESGNHSLSF